MIEKEIEKKILITEEQYRSLLNNLNINKSIKTITQINYYFDTENRALFNNDETLRVRQIEDHLELQFKYDKVIEDNIRISKELCEVINNLPKNILINEMITYNIGFLLTKRLSIEFDTYTVCLDKNFYLGKVDFEIEFEATDISNIPKELFGIQLNYVYKGKYTRFIDEFLKQRGLYEISR